jgi:tRNA(Ile)-lysidine synthase
MASTRNSSRPAEPVARVAACLTRHVRQDESLAVALSGGVDSVVLLALLHDLSRLQDFRLSAIHVHHGLSPHADEWQAFCRSLCLSLGVPFIGKRVEVRDAAAKGLEAAARQARYAAFAEVEADWLVLAHQRDDQAETLLFNLLRGTGLAGAAAMPVVRPFPGRPGLRILRPLLELSRAEVAHLARERHLDWIEDESNLDVRHARNYLRRTVMPQLRERFPGCDAALARAAAHFAEGHALLSQLAEIDARTSLREGRIRVTGPERLDEARLRNLLCHAIRRAGMDMPDSARLHEAVRQACHAAADRQVLIDLGQCMLHRYRGELWLAPKSPVPEAVVWRGEDALAWGRDILRFDRSLGGGIDLERLKGGEVRIQSRQGGERFRPDARRPRRELKKLLQEHGVPPWQRGIMPLLWCGEELVWVPGIGIDCNWQCREGETGLLPAWEVQGESQSP